MDFLIIIFNRSINFLKYPIALTFTFLTLEFVNVLFSIFIEIYQDFMIYQNFFMGMGAYIIGTILFKTQKGNWFLTIEHELTHTLFALLTFHKIIDFKASDKHGGYMQYSGVGGGNWLITIAPYFFPTFSMFIIVFIYFFEPKFYSFLVMLLGYSTLYHIHSTYYETTLSQPDIKEVGLIFSFLFLPGANLLVLIGIFSAIPEDNIDFFVITNHFYQYIFYFFNNFKF